MTDARRAAAASAAVMALVLVPLSLSSCGSGDLPLEVVDPLAAPLEPTFDDVSAILDRRCVGCHGGDGEADEAGEDDVDYSTCRGVVIGAEGILRTSVFGGSMPPGALPRLTEREKLIIDRWVEQGACAPCNPCP